MLTFKHLMNEASTSNPVHNEVFAPVQAIIDDIVMFHEKINKHEKSVKKIKADIEQKLERYLDGQLEVHDYDPSDDDSEYVSHDDLDVSFDFEFSPDQVDAYLNVTIYLSVNGGTPQKPPSRVAETAELEKVANQAIDLLKKFGFDGKHFTKKVSPQPDHDHYGVIELHYVLADFSY